MGTPGRPQQVAEVPETLLLDAGADVDDPDEPRQRQRDGDAGGRRHGDDRHDPGDVAEEDEDEQAQQERGPLQADLPSVCMTMPSSMNSIEVSARLRAPAGRPSGRAGRRAGTTRCRSAPRNGDEGDLVERREDVLPAQDLVDRWELESEHVVSVSVVSVWVGECGAGRSWRGAFMARLS